MLLLRVVAGCRGVVGGNVSRSVPQASLSFSSVLRSPMVLKASCAAMSTNAAKDARDVADRFLRDKASGQKTTNMDEVNHASALNVLKAQFSELKVPTEGAKNAKSGKDVVDVEMEEVEFDVDDDDFNDGVDDNQFHEFDWFNMPHDESTHIENSPPEGDIDFESLKVIKMEDLNRMNIKDHARQLRARMSEWEQPLPEHVVQIETRNYYSVGAHASHIPASRKAILTVKIADLGLNAAESDKLILLCGPRYNKNTDVVRIVGNRYPTREMNTLYVKDLITVLVGEAKNPRFQDPELQSKSA
eukprot:m.108082 g.108082  ORF g.108082 m.108082 type:complete len:302 (+) comp9185_c0_seq1:54-959(+)